MPNVPVANLKHAVAAQFASRPTLRQVAGEQIMKVIVAHYPLVAVHRPGLTCAEPLYLMAWQPERFWRHQPLVDVVLQAMLDSKPLAFGADDHLSLDPPQRFYAIEDRFESADGDRIEPAPLTDALNALLPMLPWHFQQAQIAYWNGQGDIDRDLWLQQVLRASLLDGLGDEALAPAQRRVLRELLLGRCAGFDVQVVQVTLRSAEDTFDERLAGLLVMASDEVDDVTLWCSPQGQVSGYDSRAAFSESLQVQMAGRYRFDAMSWTGFSADGDAFALFSALLLDILLQRLERLRWSTIDSVERLQQHFHQICDPADFFAERSSSWPGASALELPTGLQRAHKDDQTAYLQAMLDLTLLQQEGTAANALDDIPDLQSYAARRLRETMLADHPVDANYFPDDLILTVDTFANDGHGLGFGQKIDSKPLSLTELAIGRLGAAGAGVVTHIAHRNGQLIMDWMNVDYIHQLLDRVDIGANYPRHIQSLLDEPAGRDARIGAFARHWRLTLMFDAARARAVERLDKLAYGALAAFCRGNPGEAPGVRIAPLAFKRSATSALVDRVHGFYVIEIADSGAHLLYRPLYTNKALHVFDSAQALQGAIAEPGALQDSVLTWIEQSHRAIYDHGGFKEPHLPHWVFDPATPAEKPAPAQLHLQPWEQDVDRRLFEAKGQLLIELADRSAMSNSQVRWQLVTAFSWELLNVTFPLLPGPLLAVAWLYSGMRGLVNDVQGLSSGRIADQIEATVDVLSNTLMGLIHLQTPASLARRRPSDVPAAGFEGPPASQGVELAQWSAPPQASIAEVDSLHARAGTSLDFSWRGAGGLNGLSASQRSRLRGLASGVSLHGRMPQATGVHAGLITVEDRHYLTLGGDVYQVALDHGDVGIIGPDGAAGPRLLRDGHTWRVDTRLCGGTGRSAASVQERLRKKLLGPIEKALDEVRQRTDTAQASLVEYYALSEEIVALAADSKRVATQLSKQPPTDPQQLAQFETARALFMGRHQQLSEQIRQRRVRRIEVLSQVFQDYREAERNIIALFDNPSYRLTDGLAADQRHTLAGIRGSLIAFGSFLFDERLQTGPFEAYDEATRALNAAPQVQRMALYQTYRAQVERIVQEQPPLIELSCEMDRLLAVTDSGMQVPFPEGRLTVAQIIARRKVTTVNIRFFQAMSLIELTLQPHKGGATQHCLIFRDALASQRLRVAAKTHHLLMFSELSVAQRIEVLQSAWDEYLAAILNAERIKSLGSAFIDVERLEAYKQQMIELKAVAGDGLVEALREQAAGQAQGTRRVVYPPQSLQVAHTRAGQIVIGSEALVEGQPELQVTGTFSNQVLHRFHKEHGGWVETLPEDPAGPPSRASTPESWENYRELAESMLAQNDGVIAQARALLARDSDDRGLASMLDGQINEMAELREQLADAEEATALLQRIDDALVRLRQARRDDLVELYTKTRYPSARGLKFLHQQGLLRIKYVGPRHQLSDGYLDEYRINLLQTPGEAPGKPLWAAHFHFADSQAAPTAFGKGHLKRWAQRKLGYREQMAAADEGQVLHIHRGNLTYTQARDIIPFNEY